MVFKNLVALDGLSSASKQTDEGGLTSVRLDDPTPEAVRVPVKEVIGQPDHHPKPVHHDRLKLGASWTRSLDREDQTLVLYCFETEIFLSFSELFGQSYECSMIINYDSIAVLTANIQSLRLQSCNLCLWSLYKIGR